MKTESISTLRTWIHEGKLAETEEWLKDELQKSPKDDELHFWMGNLRRHQGNWQEALQYYAQATEINPESPAYEARTMLIDILQFHDKERYNV